MKKVLNFSFIFGLASTLITLSSCNKQGSSCLVGNWERNICGSSTTKAEFEFKANGSGSFKDIDCTGQCTRFFPFTWVDNESSITITYKTPTICGIEQPIPTGGSQDYLCNGSSLTLGNTYTRKN